MNVHKYKSKKDITPTKGFERKSLAQSSINCGLKSKHSCPYSSKSIGLQCHKAFEIYDWRLKVGIVRTKGFEKKHLAPFAVNCGLKCGNLCTYCFTGAILRMHEAFKALGLDPYGNDYAIIDPDTVERVARDALRIRKRGVVEICTYVDAWCPVAQAYGLGRGLLIAILSQPEWIVRILTKSDAVLKDFDVIEEYRERVLVGLSLTGTRDKAEILSVIEPNASSNLERMAVLEEAHKRGFRIYVMLCPLLPGIADSPSQIEGLVRFAAKQGAEEIFVEPVNLRGPGLKITQETLADNGYKREAAAIEDIRTDEGWSGYVTQLISNVQRSVRKVHDISRLRILLYPSRLTEQDKVRIRQDDEGVIWL